MNHLAKYSVILSLSFLIFANLSNAEDLGEFFQDVNIGQSNVDHNLYAQLVAESAPGATRHRVVTFDVSALNTDHRFEEDEVGFAWCFGESVRMTLFPDVSIVAKNERVVQNGIDTKWTWVGKIEDAPNSLIMLSFDETSVKAIGYIHTGTQLYELRPINDKYHLLIQASPNRQGIENDAVIDLSSKKLNEEPTIIQTENSGGASSILIRPFATGTWVNTPGQSLFTAESLFIQGFVLINEAFANSGITNIQLFFALPVVDVHHIDEIDENNNGLKSVGYFLNIISGDVDLALRNLRNEIAADLMRHLS